MNKQEQTRHTRSGILRFGKRGADSQDTPMSILLKRRNSKPGVRGIFAIILACISVVALASCGSGNDYTNELGTAPGAETRQCTPQIGQSGKQPSSTTVKPHLAPRNDAMFGFDAQHTHYNPYEHTLNPTNVSRLVLNWTATTAKPVLVESWSSPTVANGVVYVASNDEELYAFNATTGAVLWSTCIGAGTSSSPAVAKGVVYIGSGDGNLYALNAITGAVLWTATVAVGFHVHVDSSPAVVNGVVYVGSGDGKLYAFNATTGAVLWTTTTSADVDSSPAVANGVVYVGSHDGKVSAFNATTGTVLWSTALDPNAYFHFSSPTVANGVVYVGSGDGKLYALNATTGSVLWSVTPNSGADNKIFAPSLYTPAVANGVVYVDLGDFKVFAFHLPT